MPKDPPPNPNRSRARPAREGAPPAAAPRGVDAAGAPARATIRAALVHFAVVLAAGFALGAVRVPVLEPRLGERWAELLELPFMLVVVVLSGRLVVRRDGGRLGSRAWLAVGGLALLLMVAAEVLVVVAVEGRGLADHLAERDPVSGTAYLLSLGVFALAPWAVARRRGGRA